MYYFNVKNGQLLEVAETFVAAGKFANECVSSREFDSFEAATEMAEKATALTGKPFMAIKTGFWPNFDIIEKFVVGEEVSYGFNGDIYPAGKIKAISKTGKRITLEDGSRFTEQGSNTGRYKQNGVWRLIKGIHNERNPHF